ncbi:hypothetical protein QRX60_40615 [Amycolatopsis mongoliensis]|uniref:Uncharacterized protein n=1 Tax=Amycolatopsis mongoliensis TaxID=715475 RepID=A0A9Y2NI23_9PSEU|nr:hypothetical protein [Amycolatopsis sp. 4-36]WIY00303.1 hypothetical protein QRX60_40615 [Amycolatopsis sp. 4-36]
MRNLARIGTALGAVAVLATATAGVASAAPSGFTVDVHHSSGALATALSGSLSWSTSSKTVTIGGTSLFVKAGECITVTATGYQGSTKVTDPYAFPGSNQKACADQGVDVTGSIGTHGLTAKVPGGVEHVVIRLTDYDHQIGHYANCYRTASVCQYG